MIGKVRRALLVLQPARLAAKLEARSGDCNGCGACCSIGVLCPAWVAAPGGGGKCGVYSIRPPNCRAFPVDARDLAEVGGRCSYTFGGSP